MTIKKRNTILRKIMCFAMAGAICAQIIPANAFAATADWNLYFNPTRPPAECKTRWSSSLAATQSQASCKITQAVPGTEVQFLVDAGGGPITVTEGGNPKYIYGLRQGYVYSYIIYYSDSKNKINDTRGKLNY